MKRLTEKQFIDKTTRQLMSHLEANKLKDHLENNGYTFTISLYGVINNPETMKSEYRRVEVFVNGTPHEKDVSAIHEFFKECKPYLYYTVWAYNIEKKQIIMIGGWD